MAAVPSSGTAILLVILLCDFFSFSRSLPSPAAFPAAPAQDVACPVQCSVNTESSDLFFKYATGITYKYKMEGSTILYESSSLSNSEVSKLNYLTEFELFFETVCSGILKVNSVQLFTSSDKKYTDKKTLEGNPVRFTWENGKIKSQLCIGQNESPVALNIKRSILSNLQVSSTNLNGPFTENGELDIFGQCPTIYEYKKDATSSSSWSIQKYKDINRCMDRVGLNFDQSAGYKSNPFVKATLTSDFKVADGIIQNVYITEEYSYLPLNMYSDSGNTVNVKSRISLISQNKKGIVTADTGFRSTFLYEEATTSTFPASIETIMKALNDASSAMNSYGLNVAPTAAAEFKKFVNILRKAKKSDILAAYSQTKSGAGLKEKTIARNCFIDGLIQTNTNEAVKAAIELIDNRAFPTDRISSLASNFAYLKYVDASTVDSAITLFKYARENSDIYLGIGMLAGKYLQYNEDKKSDRSFVKLLNLLSEPLAKNYNVINIQDENTIIGSLKSLQNVKYIPDSILDAVIKYAQSPNVSNRIRSAALQALKSYPTDKVKQVALDILKETMNDAEMRIFAFHVFIQNPDFNTASEIMKLMDVEESTQVGGYITSYIRNLKNTIQSDKELTKQYLSQIHLKKNFPFDLRQYSRNIEISQIFAAINVGYSAELDLIYSANDYIPRSASVNFQTYVFGRWVNLLQFDARIENLDVPIESMFGPRGYFQNNNAEDIADDISDYVSSATDVSLANILKQSTGRFQSLLELKKKNLKNNVNMENILKLDVSIRDNDEQLQWFTYNNDLNNNANDAFSVNSLFKEISDRTSNVNYKFQNFGNTKLLASDITYPTSSGFFLSLNADFSRVINMDFTAKGNLAKMLMRPDSTNVQLDYKVGMSFTIDGLLAIDAALIKIGLRASATLNTATDLNFEFSSISGRGFEFTYNLPSDIQDIASFKTETFITLEENGMIPFNVPIIPTGPRYNYNLQSTLLSDYLGSTIQLEANLPTLSLSPNFGSSICAIRLVKTDSRVTGYYVSALFKDGGKLGNKSFSFVTEVKGRNQKLAFAVESIPVYNKVTAKLSLPSKDVELSAFIVNTRTEYSYNLNLVSDSSMSGLKVGTYISGTQLRQVYQPFIALTSPDDLKREQALSGMRLSSKVQPYLPVTISGSVIVNMKPNDESYRKIEFQSLAINSAFFESSLNGNVEYDVNNYFTSLTLSYGSERSITLFTKIADVPRIVGTDFSFMRDYSLMITSTEFPDYNFKYAVTYKASSNIYERSTIFTFGRDLESVINRVTSYEYLKLLRSPDTNKYIIIWNGKVTCPYIKLDASSDVQIDENRYSLNALYTQNNSRYSVEFVNAFSGVDKNNMDTNLKIMADDQTMTLQSKFYVKSKENHQYGFDGSVTSFSGKSISYKADIIYLWDSSNFTFQKSSIITDSSGNTYKIQYATKLDSKNIAFLISTFVNNEKYVIAKAVFASDVDRKVADTIFYLKDRFDNYFKYNKTGDLFTMKLQLYSLEDNRKLIGDGDIKTIAEMSYAGTLSLNWNVSNGDLSAIKIDTKTSFANGFQTNNKIDVMSKQFQFNANAIQTGELNDGNLNVNAELVLPNNKGSIIGDLKYLMEQSTDGVNVINQLQLYRQKVNNEIPYKFSYNFNGKNIHLTKGTFDLTAGIVLILPQSSNYDSGFVVKKLLSDQKWTVDGQFYLRGDSVGNPIDFKYQSTYLDLVYQYGIADVNLNILPASYSLYTAYGLNYTATIDASIQSDKLYIKDDLNFVYQNQKFIISHTGQIILLGDSSVQVLSDGTVQYSDNKYLKLNSDSTLSYKNGKLLLSFEADDMKKRSLAALYNVNLPKPEMNYNKGTVEASVQMMLSDEGENQLGFKYDFDDLSISLSISGESPTSGPIKAVIINKMSSDYKNHNLELSVEYKNEKWLLSTETYVDSTKPYLEVVYRTPDGESKAYIQLDKIQENHWKGKLELKWQNDGGGYLNADYESKFIFPTNLLLMINADSPKLNINQWHIDASSTNSKVERKILLNVNTANTPYLIGSLMYDFQQDEKKSVLQATGHVKIEDKSYPLVFKYAQQNYNLETDGEEGSLDKCYISFDGKKSVINIERKITDKSIILRREHCIYDDCHTIGVSYEFKGSDILNYEKNVLIQFDMSPMIKGGENIVVASKTVSDGITFDHTIDFQWAPGKVISYKSYVNKEKMGASLIMPKREIAAELTYTCEFSLSNGEVKTMAVIWLDKKQNEKNKIIAVYGSFYSIDQATYKSATKTSLGLQIPSLSKKLAVITNLEIDPRNKKVVDFKGNFDLFNKDDQALLVTYQLERESIDDEVVLITSFNIASKGQHLDIKSKTTTVLGLDKLAMNIDVKFIDLFNMQQTVTVDVNYELTQISLTVNILDLIRFKEIAAIDFGRNYGQISNQLELFDHKYGIILKATLEPRLLITLQSEGYINQKLDMSVAVVFREAVYVTVILTGKGRKNLVSTELSLAEKNFLTSETNLNLDTAIEMMDGGKKDINNLLAINRDATRKIGILITDGAEFRLKQIQNALIPRSAITGAISDFIRTVNKELLSDESFKSATDNLNSILNEVTKVLNILNNHIADIIDKLGDAVEVLLNDLLTLLRRLMPSFFKWLDDTFEYLTDYFNSNYENAKNTIIDYADYIRTINTRWNSILKSIMRSAKNLSDNFPKIREQVISMYNVLVDRVTYYIETNHLYAFMKFIWSKVKETNIPRYICNVLTAINQWLKDYLPTPEVKALLDSILEVVEKILLQKPIDWTSEGKIFVNELADAVRSLWKLIRNAYNYENLIIRDYVPTINLGSIRNALMLSSNAWPVTVGLVRWLRYPDFSSLNDLFYIYRPSLNPADWIPPFTKAAVLIDGGYVVNFNGRYFHVQDSCTLLLTSDVDTNDFKVTANYENGQINYLEILAVEIEKLKLLNTGKVLFNNAEADFPIYGKYITAIRTVYFIEIKIKGAVRIVCTPDLKIISLHVSGFYVGKLDGILGSANGESSLDTVSRDGIKLSLSDFIQSYSTGKVCTAAPEENADITTLPEPCSEFFSTKSTLRKAFSIIKLDPYREMCYQMANKLNSFEDRLQAACKVSLAYSLVSSANGDYLKLPSQCGSCKIGDNVIPLNTDVSVSTPQKKAEILIILDQSESSKIIYSSILTKLITNLSSTLKTAEIDDIKFVLMTYGPDAKYPSIQTTNGQIYFSETTKVKFSDLYVSKKHTTLGTAVLNIKYALGYTDITGAMTAASGYRFSADATKAIIIARGRPDERVTFDTYDVFNFINGILPAQKLLHQGIPVIQILPSEKVIYNGDTSLNIYGFDNNHLYTVQGVINVTEGVIMRTNLYQIYQSSMLLTLPLNGAVFSSNDLASVKDNTKIFEILLNRLSDSLKIYEKHLECTCRYRWGNYAEPICVVRSSRVIM